MRPVQGYAEAHAPQKPKAEGRERFASKRDDVLRAFVRRQSCLLAAVGPENGCRGLVEAAHVKAKGTGAGDWENLVSLCGAHHRELHYIGRRSFEYRHQVKLGALARKTAAAYLKQRQASGT